MTIIPFENVLAVGEDPTCDGQLVVGLNTPLKESSKMIIPHGDVEAFLEQYNAYLMTVESLTLTVRLVQDDEAGES